MLYNATRILLDRPFIGGTFEGSEAGAATADQLAREARAACFSAAEEIHHLLELHGKTFEHKNMIYSRSSHSRNRPTQLIAQSSATAFSSPHQSISSNLEVGNL